MIIMHVRSADVVLDVTVTEAVTLITLLEDDHLAFCYPILIPYAKTKEL